MVLYVYNEFYSIHCIHDIHLEVHKIGIGKEDLKKKKNSEFYHFVVAETLQKNK